MAQVGNYTCAISKSIMKNGIHTLTKTQSYQELINGMIVCLKNPVRYIKNRLITIYLTGIELLYILYK